MNGAPHFSLLGPLPQGTTVLEASAGTGKTFTIAGLVARYVAEGAARLDQLLVVTFGRAATHELRDRVRERLVSARDGLADPAAARGSDDDLLAFLATADGSEVLVRRRRLATALASFDAATIATTHQFCQQVLINLGTAGDVDPGAVLIENLDDLIVEVTDDLYLAKWSRDGAEPPVFSRKEALSLARAVVGDGQALLVPGDPAAGEIPAVRRAFAVAVRAEFARRKRQRRILGFDDLLTLLRDTLTDPDLGPAAAARLRGRYSVVLVDEFQDTDPVQWEILQRAFHGAVTMVLIGDPKQAIYAFRGADVLAYLAAAAIAGTHATLAQNWRSDPDLLRGLEALFRNAALGDPRIVVHPVSAAHQGRSLDPPQAPVRLRVLLPAGDVPVADARAQVTQDVVGVVVALLDSRAMLTPRKGPARPVRPGDLAVLVPTAAHLELVHAALLAAGVPAVQRSTSSVFKTAAGTDWLVLLEALEQPHRVGRVRRLALSAFVGWDAPRLQAQDSDELGLRVRRWLEVFEQRGVAALFGAVSASEGLAARMLGELDGERRLTDLTHVGEALHAAAMDGQLGLTASLEWLRRRVEESEHDMTQERSRRLDSDAEAVQVVTIHASKGLEFPVVYVPFLWDRYVHDVSIPLFHEPSGRRVRDVGGKGASFAGNAKRGRAEEFGEDLRLLYVALTRAQAQVTAWWAPNKKNTPCAPLHRLLFTDDPASGVPHPVAVPSGPAALVRLQALSRAGCLSVTEVVAPAKAAAWVHPTEPAGSLQAAAFGRTLDTAWRRTSYSALTSFAHDAGPVVGSEPELSETDDEPATVPETPVRGDEHLHEVASPMADLPGGAAFGTLVHAVLEHLDPMAADLDGALREQTALQLVRDGGELRPEELAAALLPSVRTPLGPLVGDMRLVDIPLADRLAELDFELPLCGGDEPSGQARVGDLASLLREYLPADDPLAAYAGTLAGPLMASTPLSGYLAGSIDVVLRVGGRYVIADYKTNRLGPGEEPLTAWHYRAPALAEAMMRAHYPLQALLYEVALHRFLRWRVAGYDPQQHLGGVLYLFLRGMCGPGVLADDGSIPGVFSWQPPAALVLALSDVLSRGGS